MRDFDDSNAAQRFTRKSTLVTVGPDGVDQPSFLIEADCGCSYSAPLCECPNSYSLFDCSHMRRTRLIAIWRYTQHRHTQDLSVKPGRLLKIESEHLCVVDALSQ